MKATVIYMIFNLIMLLINSCKFKKTKTVVDYFPPECHEFNVEYENEIVLPDTLCPSKNKGIAIFITTFGINSMVREFTLYELLLANNDTFELKYINYECSNSYPPNILPFYNYFLSYKDSVQISIEMPIKNECDTPYYYSDVLKINAPPKELIDRGISFLPQIEHNFRK